jgi:tetratricopeptide (TPR) repeat protein
MNLGIENDDLSYISGLAYLRLKNSESSIGAFKKISAKDNAEKYVLSVLESLANLESKDYQPAIKILREVIAEDFSNQLDFSAHIILAYCHLQNDDIPNAETILNEIPISNEFYPQIPITSSTRYGFYDISNYFESLLNAIIVNSNSPAIKAKAFAFIARYKYNTINYSNIKMGINSDDLLSIKEYLLKSLEVFPQEAELHIFLANVLEDLKDWIGSIEHSFLSQSLSSKNDYSDLDSRIINAIHEDQSLLEQFLTLFDTFIEDYPQFCYSFSGRSLSTLVEYFHNKKEYELVIHIAEKFSYEKLKEAEILFEIAFAYSESGNKKRAKNIYRAYLRDVGNNPAVANNLALFEEEDGNLHEAERLLKLALELDPSDDKAQANLARVQGKLKKLDEQKRAILKAAELFIQEPDNYRRVIAELYAQRTEDDLILCDLQKTSSKLGVKLERGKNIVSEFLQKNYFEEVEDHGLTFSGRVLQINPIIIPHLEKELERVKKLDFIDKISERLLTEGSYPFDRP